MADSDTETRETLSKKKRTGKSCSVAGCTGKNSDGLSVHKFPEDAAIRRQWINFVKTRRADFFAPSVYSVICERHFSPECYPVKYQLSGALGLEVKRKQLLPSAVPTIQVYRVVPSSSVDFTTAATQTTCTTGSRFRPVPSPVADFQKPCTSRPRRAYVKREHKRVTSGNKQARSPRAPSAAPEQASMSDEAVEKDYVVNFTEDFPSPDAPKASFSQLDRHDKGVQARLRHLRKSTRKIVKPLMAEVAVQCSLRSAPPLNVFPATSVSAQKLGTMLPDQAEHLRPLDHEDSRQPGNGTGKDTETSQQGNPSICFKTEPVDLDDKPMVHDISATLNLDAFNKSYKGKHGISFKTETVEVVSDSCCPSVGVPALADEHQTSRNDPSVCFKTEPMDLDRPMVHDNSATLNLDTCNTSYAGRHGTRFKTETVEVVSDSCCPSASVPALADEHQTSRSTSCKREDFDVLSEKMGTCDEKVCVKTEPCECDENDTETVQSCSACKHRGRSRRLVHTDRIFADSCESSDIDKDDSSFCGLKMECDNAYDSDSNVSTSQKSNVSTERQNVAQSLGGDCVTNYTCQQCGAELSPFDLIVEMQNSSLKSHKCEECGSAFASASNLAHHVIMRSHAGGEKCRCLHCGGLFQGTKKMKLNNFVVEKEKEGNSLVHATIGTVHEGVEASMEEKSKFAFFEKLVVLEGSSVSTEAEKRCASASFPHKVDKKRSTIVSMEDTSSIRPEPNLKIVWQEIAGVHVATVTTFRPQKSSPLVHAVTSTVNTVCGTENSTGCSMQKRAEGCSQDVTRRMSLEWPARKETCGETKTCQSAVKVACRPFSQQTVSFTSVSHQVKRVPSILKRVKCPQTSSAAWVPLT